jgi:hypothetical protein
MWLKPLILFVAVFLLCAKSSKAFYYVPSEKNYLYYGLAWHPKKVWHSFEYNLQSDQWQFKHKTIGFNFQFAKDVKSVGLTFDRGFHIRSERHILAWRLIVPFVGINPNYLKVENVKSFNLKPRIGVLLRSGWRFKNAGPQVNLKLSYGLDIPFGVESIHRYNPHEFLVQLGISFKTHSGLFGNKGYKWIKSNQSEKKKKQEKRATF